MPRRQMLEFVFTSHSGWSGWWLSSASQPSGFAEILGPSGRSANGMPLDADPTATHTVGGARARHQLESAKFYWSQMAKLYYLNSKSQENKRAASGRDTSPFSLLLLSSRSLLTYPTDRYLTASPPFNTLSFPSDLQIFIAHSHDLHRQIHIHYSGKSGSIRCYWSCLSPIGWRCHRSGHGADTQIDIRHNPFHPFLSRIKFCDQFGDTRL